MATTSASQLKVNIVLDSDGLHSGLRRASRDTTRFSRSIHHSSMSTARFTRSLGGLTRAAVGAAAAAVPLSLAVRTMTRETIAFDAGMRDVNSLTQLSEKRFQSLSQSVLDLAGPTAQAPRTLADGLYSLVSSGFDSKEALNVLAASAKAASAGLTTTATSSAAVAAALNAYRLPAKRAGIVSDVLFKTVDRGVVTFEQLAKYIGDVLPFSASLSVGLKEVGAAIATMTKEGIGPPETMIRIKNVMVSLLKPGDELKNTVKELGYDSAEAMIKAEGFQKTLQILAETTGGSKQKLAELFPNIRALSGVLALTGKNTRSAEEDLHHLAEASGATDRALSQQSQSISYQWRKLKATASALAIEFGNKLVPTVKDVLKVFNDPGLTVGQKFEVLKERLIEIINDLAPQAADAAGQVGVEIAKAMGSAFVKTGFLGRVAIGALVIRSLGGPAAIAAAGKQVGGLLGAGTKAAETTTKAISASGHMSTTTVADLTKFTQVATDTVKVIARQGAIIAAFVISIEAAMGAVKLFSKDAKGLNDYLDQTISRGETIQAQAQSLFDTLKLNQLPLGGLIGAGSKALFGDLKEEKRIAEGLKKNLVEIGDADRERFRTLKRVIARRVDELDLTERQRKEIDKIVGSSKIAERNAAGAAIQQMNATIASGAFVGGDLQRAIEQQLARINDTYGRWTPRWRAQVEATFRAQIDATRRTYTRAGELTREGQRRIQEIIARRARLMQSGDPIGIAKAVVNGWKRAGSVNDAGIKRFVGRLAKMPPAARKQAAATMVAYARELENKGKLPEGTVKRLRSKILLRGFGPDLWRSIKDATNTGFRGVGQAFQRGTDEAVKKLDKLELQTKEHAKKVKRNITSIPGPVKTAYSRLAAYANETATAFGSSQRVKLSFRSGGRVPGRNLVPAALSPGELVSYRGRELYVPGRPEPRDSVLMYLPVGAKVFTRDGQMRLAAGASETEALRKQAPHFAKGGIVNDLPRPRLSGGSPVPTATGQAAIDRGRRQAKTWIEKLEPTLKSMEKIAANFGLGISSGYRPGDDGFHGINRARDFAGSAGDMSRFARYVGARFTRFLLEGIYNPDLSVDSGRAVSPSFWGAATWADHRDHVHIAMRKGGYVKNINRIWNEHNAGSGDWGGPTLPSFVVAALAEAAGMPGKTMEQVTRGESGAHSKNTARPGATGIDPGGTKGHGLWMITSGFNEDLARKVGGWKNMLNPVVNAWAAAQIYQRQGLGAWYGTGSVTGDGQHWNGKYDIRNALGGLTFDGALWVATGGRIGEKPKAITAVQRGAGKLLNRTDRKRRRFKRTNTGTKRAFEKLRKADRLAKRARELVKQGKLTQAQILMDRANKLVADATGRKPKPDDKKPAPPPPGAPPAPTTVAGLLEMAKGPGLSAATRESILSNAYSIAQGTTGTEDDLAVLGEQKTLQEKIRANAQARLDRARETLAKPKFSAENIKDAEKKRDRALADKATAEKNLRKKNLTDAQRKRYEADLQSANRRLREANDVLRPYGKAIEAQNNAAADVAAADSELASINASIGEINNPTPDGGGETDLATAMKELADAITEQNRLQSSVQATSSREALRMLSDVISGEIVGKRAPVNQTPVGVRY